MTSIVQLMAPTNSFYGNEPLSYRSGCLLHQFTIELKNTCGETLGLGKVEVIPRRFPPRWSIEEQAAC
jgi:hypothetical protein